MGRCQLEFYQIGTGHLWASKCLNLRRRGNNSLAPAWGEVPVPDTHGPPGAPGRAAWWRYMEVILFERRSLVRNPGLRTVLPAPLGDFRGSVPREHNGPPGLTTPQRAVRTSRKRRKPRWSLQGSPPRPTSPLPRSNTPQETAGVAPRSFKPRRPVKPPPICGCLCADVGR